MLQYDYANRSRLPQAHHSLMHRTLARDQARCRVRRCPKIIVHIDTTRIKTEESIGHTEMREKETEQRRTRRTQYVYTLCAKSRCCRKCDKHHLRCRQSGEEIENMMWRKQHVDIYC